MEGNGRDERKRQIHQPRRVSRMTQHRPELRQRLGDRQNLPKIDSSINKQRRYLLLSEKEKF